jgi:hypothetical protein
MAPVPTDVIYFLYLLPAIAFVTHTLFGAMAIRLGGSLFAKRRIRFISALWQALLIYGLTMFVTRTLRGLEDSTNVVIEPVLAVARFAASLAIAWIGLRLWADMTWRESFFTACVLKITFSVLAIVMGVFGTLLLLSGLYR